MHSMGRGGNNRAEEKKAFVKGKKIYSSHLCYIRYNRCKTTSVRSKVIVLRLDKSLHSLKRILVLMIGKMTQRSKDPDSTQRRSI